MYLLQDLNIYEYDDQTLPKDKESYCNSKGKNPYSNDQWGTTSYKKSLELHWCKHVITIFFEE